MTKGRNLMTKGRTDWNGKIQEKKRVWSGMVKSGMVSDGQMNTIDVSRIGDSKKSKTRLCSEYN